MSRAFVGFLKGAGVLLLVLAAWFAGNRVFFLRHAVETTGTVREIFGENSRCGGGKRRPSYNCTKFYMQAEYASPQGKHRLSIAAGKVRGHNQPPEACRRRVGDVVPVVYDARDPSRAAHNEFFALWGLPILLSILSGIVFVVLLVQNRRGNLSRT
ncbi:MAG: DUF3592 domain-containing protein [Bacteriovoracia bacterium]